MGSKAKVKTGETDEFRKQSRIRDHKMRKVWAVRLIQGYRTILTKMARTDRRIDRHIASNILQENALTFGERVSASVATLDSNGHKWTFCTTMDNMHTIQTTIHLFESEK